MESWEQKTLVKFSSNSKDHWTVDDSMKGTSILGATGSGKSSGSGKTIALQFLKQGWGGLVLCAKTEEANLWREYCKQTGRENDLIIFGKNSIHSNGKYVGQRMVFNPLQYEMSREGEGGGDLFNLTNLFMNLNKMSNRASNEGEAKKDDRFWDNALKRIISRTIDLIDLAGEELTYKNMIELIYTAPTEKNPFNSVQFDNFKSSVKYEDEHEGALKANYFLKCLAKAFNNVVKEDENSPNVFAYNTIQRYFVSSLPYMSENTHNAIIESFMGVAEPFLSGMLYQHFSGETNITPEEIFTDNKIIVLDFPVKEFLDAGIMAQGIFKLIFQQAIERRDVKVYPKPVFLWIDEAQYFINPYDQIFLTTARSARTASVYLSQSISNYFAVMGAGEEAKARVNSLMGNLTTKIFHANADAETNEYASRLIGSSLSILKTKGTSNPFLSFDFKISNSDTQHYLPQIQPMEFTTLKSGGKRNNFTVQGVFFSTGRIWSSGTNYIIPEFQQNFTS